MQLRCRGFSYHTMCWIVAFGKKQYMGYTDLILWLRLWNSNFRGSLQLLGKNKTQNVLEFRNRNCFQLICNFMLCDTTCSCFWFSLLTEMPHKQRMKEMRKSRKVFGCSQLLGRWICEHHSWILLSQLWNMKENYWTT